MGDHPLLGLTVSLQLGTRHRTPAWLRLGPAKPVTLSPLDIRVARAWSAARGGGSCERDTGSWPGLAGLGSGQLSRSP